MGALLADRPEQETGEAAVPARSDDEEIARRDRMDEDVDGAALDDLALDFETLAVGLHVDDHVVEQFFGRLAKIVEAGAREGGDRAVDIGLAVARAPCAEKSGRRDMNDPQSSPS
jgi:hypothetical protein